jgi:hypothetical protein
MGKSAVRRSRVACEWIFHRQRKRKRGLATSTYACGSELLERRLMLSGSPVLHGPVSSAVTAAWYAQRVASLQQISPSHQAKPGFEFQKQTNSSPLLTAAPDPAGITPQQIESYYGFTGLSFGSTPANGRGQTIAVVEAYDDPDITQDLQTFDSAYRLSAPPSFSVVSQTGSTTQLPAQDQGDPVNGSWALEESLDVEWAHTLAPAASIMVVECNSQNDSDLYAGVAYAASAPGVSVVSMSFGESETDYTQSALATIDATFVTPPGHQGVTFLAASGDQGAYSGNGPLALSFPSSSPEVVSVGGTTLLTNSSGKITGESAWSGSGGGISTLEKQTAAQKAAVGTDAGRANPDVSFDADPNSGVNVCDSLDFSTSTPFTVVGGTSFSAPAWGAILAITNQGRVVAGKTTLDGQQQTIPALYADYSNGTYSSVFQDITTGNNGYYTAGKGYDLVTGLGSPNVKNLVPELATNTVHSTPPVIGSLVSNPAVENIGTPVTLTASDITDTVGNVAGVNFYRTSGTGSTLLGAGVLGSAGSWSLSISTSKLSVGNYTYTAIATNNFKVSGLKVSTTNKVTSGQATPTIGSFVVQPWDVPVGTSITLVASSVVDTTGPVASVAFYVNSGSAPTLLGNGISSGNGRWTLSVSTDDWVPGEYQFTAIAIAASGIVSAPLKAIDKVTMGPPMTVVVNTTTDQTDPLGSRTVSLRDAVALADLGIGQVTIEFDPKAFSTFKTIDLTGITLSLTDTAAPTIIDGPGAGVGISGNNTVQVFAIRSSAVVSMSNLTIIGGASTSSGGGMINAGDTTLTNVTISDNVDSGLVGNGGGIENDGILNLIDSTITGNRAANGNGGGLYNTGTISVRDSSIYGNTAFNGGGVGSNGALSVNGSTISNNQAFEEGGGIENVGNMSLVSSTVSGNSAATAGGVYTGPGYDDPTKPLATIVNSTIAQNTASYADGGILNAFGGNLVISDSTIAINSAHDSYGGLNSEGNTTIANTIVAGNTISSIVSEGADVSGVIISKGHNLIGEQDGSSGWISSDDRGTVSTPLNPHLSPLGQFGGGVQTLVPLTGSLAIGHGSVSLIPGGISTDERGFARVVAGKVDIGAVQVQGTTTVKLTAATNQPAVAGQSAYFKLGSFTDSTERSPYNVIIEWGDGSADSTVSVKSAGSITPQSHEYDLIGTVVVSVLVTNSAGSVSNLISFDVKIAPPPPEILMVNTIADQLDPAGSKTLSLRDAINDANLYFGPAMIEFNPTIFASHETITLDSADLNLANNTGTISIIGPAAGVTISGAGKTDVLYTATGVHATISNLAIVDGGGANGGGITNLGTLSIVDSTISGNTYAGNGAGIDNFGTLSMVNSTLANNRATLLQNSAYLTGDGGALYNATGAAATITNVTITGNSAEYAGGIYTAGNLTIGNSIVAGNTAAGGASAPDIAGQVSSIGHNLVGEVDPSASQGWLSTDFTGTVATPLNPHLSPLGNHGGPTETAIPETGSKAIGNGAVSLIPKGITTDQRGQPRTIKDKVDIGAVEI